MLRSSFKFFFIIPVKELSTTVWGTIKHTFQTLRKAIWFKELKALSEEENIKESYRIFQLLLFLIFANVIRNKFDNGDIASDVVIQIMLTINYYLLFLSNFYIGKFGDRFYRSEILGAFSGHIFRAYTILVIFILISSDLLDANIELIEQFEKLDGFTWSLTSLLMIHLTVLYFLFIRRKWVQAKTFGYFVILYFFYTLAFWWIFTISVISIRP